MDREDVGWYDERISRAEPDELNVGFGDGPSFVLHEVNMGIMTRVRRLTRCVIGLFWLWT